jgi:Double zinc ribbon
MQSTDCPFCTHANPAGAKFCNECGSPLHLAPCRHCDAVNHVDDVQCYRCGASLAPRTVAAQASGDSTGLQPIGLDQQARWVEQEILRFDDEPNQPAPASASSDAGEGASESGTEAIAHDPGAVDPALHEVEPQWREPVRAEAGSLAGASAFSAGGRSGPQFWPSRGSSLPEARRLFGEIVDPPRSRWPELLGGVSAALVVLALIAGGYWYYSRNLASRLAEREVAGRAPVHSDRSSVDEAAATPRPERTSLAPQAKAIDAQRFDVNAPPLPVESPSAAGGTGVPEASTRGEEGMRAPIVPPDSSAQAAVEPQCPPAVAAMALCDWIARANRN